MSHGGYGSVLALALAAGYAVLTTGSTRPWSRWRTASFLFGCLLLILAAASGHDTGFAASMHQHGVAQQSQRRVEPFSVNAVLDQLARIASRLSRPPSGLHPHDP